MKTCMNCWIAKKDVFDDITNKLIHEQNSLDSCMDDFSTIIYDISFLLHGKTVKPTKAKKNSNYKKSLWFDGNCRDSKREFYFYKRICKDQPSDVNRERFLCARNKYCTVKRDTKRKYYYKEKNTLSNLSRTNPRKFWRYINKYKTNSNTNSNNIDINEFVEHFKQTSNTAFEFV